MHFTVRPICSTTRQPYQKQFIDVYVAARTGATKRDCVVSESNDADKCHEVKFQASGNKNECWDENLQTMDRRNILRGVYHTYRRCTHYLPKQHQHRVSACPVIADILTHMQLTLKMTAPPSGLTNRLLFNHAMLRNEQDAALEQSRTH